MKKIEINFKRVNLKLRDEAHRLMIIHCSEVRESVQDFVEKAVLYFLSMRLEKEHIKKITMNFDDI